MGPHAPSNADKRSAGSANRSAMHNAAVDEPAATEGGCAQVHLPTGRMCTLRRGHQGSCEFVAVDQADASLARHRADEGW
jgi:hypothetical protein